MSGERWFILIVRAIILFGILALLWAEGLLWGAVSWLGPRAESAESIAPFLTPVLALLAAVIAYESFRHRRLSDEKAEWDRRADRAVDLLLDDDPARRITGLILARALLDDSIATGNDAKLLDDMVAEITAFQEEAQLYEVGVQTPDIVARYIDNRSLEDEDGGDG